MKRDFRSALDNVKPGTGKWSGPRKKLSKGILMFGVGNTIWFKNDANGPNWMQGNMERICTPVLYGEGYGEGEW